MQLDKILRVGGVDTFLSLQEELPPQDQMKLGGVNGFLPYRATAELIQAALNPPPCASSSPEAKTLSFIRYPIVDFGLPDASPESLGTLLAHLKRLLEAGKKLYIHCWGGKGRTGTIGACLLGKAYGLSADEALSRVQKAFDTRTDEGRSPETDAQHKFVTDYIDGL
jgi:protein-tyrosine phosphatase